MKLWNSMEHVFTFGIWHCSVTFQFVSAASVREPPRSMFYFLATTKLPLHYQKPFFQRLSGSIKEIFRRSPLISILSRRPFLSEGCVLFCILSYHTFLYFFSQGKLFTVLLCLNLFTSALSVHLIPYTFGISSEDPNTSVKPGLTAGIKMVANINPREAKFCFDIDSIAWVTIVLNCT